MTIKCLNCGKEFTNRIDMEAHLKSEECIDEEQVGEEP